MRVLHFTYSTGIMCVIVEMTGGILSSLIFFFDIYAKVGTQYDEPEFLNKYLALFDFYYIFGDVSSMRQ